jgi:PAS domain S-box-containing protein
MKRMDEIKFQSLPKDLKWLLTLFDNHPDAMIVSRIRDGRIDRVNPSFLKLFGYSGKAVIGKDIDDLCKIEKDGRRESIGLIARQGGIRDKKVTIRPKAGEIRRAGITIIPIEDDDDPLMLTVIHDVTDRKQIDERPTQDQEMVQNLIDHIPVMIIIWNPNLDHFTLNRHAESVLGWTTADANQGDFMSKLYPDPVYRSEVLAFMQSLSPDWREWNTTAKDGGTVPGAWTNTRLSDNTMIGIGVDLRERNRVLSALQESENNFRIALANSNFIPSQFDRDQRYRWIFNPHPDFSPAFAIGKRDDELEDSEGAKRLRILKQKVIETGMGVREEITFKRSDGTRFYDFMIEPLHDADGGITGGTCGAYDITRQKLAEQSLRESEERFRTMADGLPLIIWVHDAKGRQQFVNRTFQEFFGVTKEETQGGHWQLLMHPDDAAAYTAEFEACLHDRRPFHAMVRVWHASGEWRWIESWGRPRITASGEFLGYVGTSADITERKQAEKALQDSEARSTIILNAVPDLFFIHSQEGVYLDSHASDDRLLVAKPNELLGKNIFDVLPDKLADRYWQSMKRAIQTRRTQLLEYELELPMGLKFFEARIAVMDDDRLISIIRDITERRHAENALRQLNETLEKQVADRTRVAESRSKLLQSLAVELVQAEEFERQRIADLLHDDLQQLIASARMQVQSAFDKDDPGPILENVEQLLGDSLEKSRRLSHELSPPVLHQFGLAAALEWLVRHMDEKFGLKVRLESLLTSEVKDAPLRVFLFRAAQELLFNVVKHAGVHSADVRLYESENRIALSVADRGKGIDRDILDSFKKKSGFGLMSLSERAAAIGGNLKIESEQGQGSLFILSVPVSLADDSEQKPARVPVLASGKSDRQMPVSDPETIRVLFADDHKVMRQGLVSMVAGQPGIKVAGEAGSGEEALELAERLRPDVIIMDISMPGMGGVEATRCIKAQMPDIRVIGLSMFTDEDISRKMREAGADGFISKSESSSELLKKIYNAPLS